MSSPPGDAEAGDSQTTELIPTRPNSPEKSELSEHDSLTLELQKKPLNPEGWVRLVRLAEDSGDIDKIRSAYDGLLKIYPNTSSAQILYINHFLHDPSTFRHAEDLFKKYLRASPSVDLWKFYLTYVRRVNTGPATRDNIKKSYEFALDHVGQDKESGEIWSDYIDFLKQATTSSTWEEQQKMDNLRKVYHRGVQIPLDNVEKLWQELETFETNLNKTTAKKFMADLSPGHMQARTALRQLTNNYLPGLYPPPSSEIFLPSLPTFNAAERQLVGKWKAYLKWELDNPLEIEDKDKNVLIGRIQAVFRKAVIRMRFFPEIWYMAYSWTISVGKSDDALAILKVGMEANATSALLHFTYAEIMEVKKDYAAVHSMYEKLLNDLRTELDELKTQITPPSSFTEKDAVNEPHPSAVVADSSDYVNGTSMITDAGPSSRNSSFGSQSSDEIPSKTAELAERRTEYGLVWIMYMRFGRRAEGIKTSRNIFSKARKDTQWLPWEVFDAAALMEYHCSDDKQVASRIFEKGLEQFSKECAFVERYLAFLISVNDKNNARALFERVVPTFSPDVARPLWERWSRYEYQCGDLEASLKLEKRIAEVYPNETPIKRFAQRHMYQGTDAIAARDLGFSQARKSAGSKAKQPLSRTESGASLPSPLPTAGASNKRPPSPDRRTQNGPDHGSAHKRHRAGSIERDHRDRERWDRRRSPPPPWDRNAKDKGVARRDREDEKPPVPLPHVLSWFVGQLPPPSSFDGPVFRTEDLMNLFRNAVIPSSNQNRVRSPPTVPSPRGRPPPDYGPYQGPRGGGGGRRY